MLATSAAAARPAVLPLFAAAPAPDRVSGLFHAATELARLLGQGRALDSRACARPWRRRSAPRMRRAPGPGRTSYEAAEAAQVLFLRKFGRAMRTRAGSATAMLDMLTRLAERLPSQTRRSEESNRFQQFSTPIALGPRRRRSRGNHRRTISFSNPRPGRASWRSSPNWPAPVWR